MRVNALRPTAEPRVPVAERHVLDEDPVEDLVVPRRQAEDGVFEERERDHVSDAEFPVEVIPPVEQILEDVERRAHARPQLLDAARVRVRCLELGRDQVRGPLPELVEPVDENLHLRAPRGLARIERWFGVPALQPRENAWGVRDDLVAVDEHRDEPLAAHRLDGRAVIRVDVDPLDCDRLVSGCERDPLDVGREGNSVDADQIQLFRLKNTIWPIVVATITPHENA